MSWFHWSVIYQHKFAGHPLYLSNLFYSKTVHSETKVIKKLAVHFLSWKRSSCFHCCHCWWVSRRLGKTGMFQITLDDLSHLHGHWCMHQDWWFTLFWQMAFTGGVHGTLGNWHTMGLRKAGTQNSPMEIYSEAYVLMTVVSSHMRPTRWWNSRLNYMPYKKTWSRWTTAHFIHKKYVEAQTGLSFQIKVHLSCHPRPSMGLSDLTIRLFAQQSEGSSQDGIDQKTMDSYFCKWFLLPNAPTTFWFSQGNQKHDLWTDWHCLGVTW